MSALKQSLQQKWQDLTSTQRQKMVKFAVGGAVLSLVILSYYLSGEAEKRSTSEVEVVKKKLNLGGDLFKDDIQQKVKTDLKEQNTLIDEQSKRVAILEQVLPAIQQELSRLKADDSAVSASNGQAEQQAEQQGNSYPPSPNYPPSTYHPPPGYQNLPNEINSVPAPPEEIIGGVGHSIGETHKQVNETKKQKGFYLAPGFMQAQLLHGIEAYTSAGAMSDPEPLLIRVQAPAVLPNDIRAQLTGCFVIANMHGSLAKERVEGQVVNLTCLSPDGSAVIDQEVLGYVVDNDGQKGLDAKIVSKMGQHISRSFVAGLAGGFGEGVSNSGLQNSITGAGQVQTFDAGKVGQSALGQGLKDASTDIKKLFLELARQTMPVAEVEAARNCSVVLQKGVELMIRQRDIF